MGNHSMDNLLNNSASQIDKPKLIAIAVVAFLLQTILAPNMAISDISPNFFIVGLAIVLAKSSQKTATIAGFAAGLIFDLLGSGPVGCMSLSMAIVCYFACTLSDLIKLEDIVSWLIIVGILTLAINMVYCIILSISGFESSFFGALVFKVLPWTIYTVIVSAAFWPVVNKFVGLSRPSMAKSKIQI